MSARKHGNPNWAEDDEEIDLQPHVETDSNSTMTVDVTRLGQAFYEQNPSYAESSQMHAPTIIDQMEALTEDGEFELVLPEDLPEHACSYCGHTDGGAAVQCNTCKKWFCNGKGRMNASHIVIHMLSSKHKECCTHEDSVLGHDVLECYICQSKNVFMLGFVPSKEDKVVVLICREPCLHSTALKNHDWDPEAWLPLVEGRQLLNWIATAPKSADMGRCRPIRFKQALQLEELWKVEPTATFDDMARGAVFGKTDTAVSFIPVPKRFRDGMHYVDIFEPLIEAERRANKEHHDASVMTDVNITWKTTVNKRVAFEFTVNDDNSLFPLGSFVQISLGESGQARFWEDRGVVIKSDIDMLNGSVIQCELSPGPDNAPTTVTGGFRLMPEINTVQFQRMSRAVEHLANKDTSISAFLFYALMAHNQPSQQLEGELPEELQAPGLSSLNPSQERAIRQVLTSPLSLIQGPPGTGKTLTTATVVYHMSRMYKAQILVCAPSNVAVDHLADRLSKTGLSVVRVLSKGREQGLPCLVDALCLHTLVGKFAGGLPSSSTLKRLHNLREEVGTLQSKDFDEYMKLREAVEERILGAADVICTTCSTAADKRLANFRMKHVVVDESTQACEPEVLIPFVSGAKQICLVGDHCQLGPITMSKAASAAGFGISLFERLVSVGYRPHRLEVQYRMHPFLAEFSSTKFYDGALQNGVTAAQRTSSQYFPWPDPTKPLFFYNTNAPEEMGSSGTSCLNRTEAALAEKIVSHLMRNGANPDQIAVITPYTAQRGYLVNYLARNGPLGAEAYSHVEVASVDSFQGREKDFIIISCVRSNESSAIGFLKDWRRLNVALTRARLGLMVIGNAKVLSRHPLWHDYLEFCQRHDLLVDGPLQDLQPAHIKLPRPRQSNEPADDPLAPAGTVSVQHHVMQAPEADSALYTRNSNQGRFGYGVGSFGGIAEWVAGSSPTTYNSFNPLTGAFPMHAPPPPFDSHYHNTHETLSQSPSSGVGVVGASHHPNHQGRRHQDPKKNMSNRRRQT